MKGADRVLPFSIRPVKASLKEAQACSFLLSAREWSRLMPEEKGFKLCAERSLALTFDTPIMDSVADESMTKKQIIRLVKPQN